MSTEEAEALVRKWDAGKGNRVATIGISTSNLRKIAGLGVASPLFTKHFSAKRVQLREGDCNARVSQLARLLVGLLLRGHSNPIDVGGASFPSPFLPGFFHCSSYGYPLAGGLRPAGLAIVLSMLGYPVISMLPASAKFGWQQGEIEAVLLITSSLIALLAVRQQEARKRLGPVVIELQKALEEVRTLRGMIPICASCKKIRDDDGYWIALERYIQERTYAKFTHGMCKECILKHYPAVYPELFPADSHKAEAH